MTTLMPAVAGSVFSCAAHLEAVELGHVDGQQRPARGAAARATCSALSPSMACSSSKSAVPSVVSISRRSPGSSLATSTTRRLAQSMASAAPSARAAARVGSGAAASRVHRRTWLPPLPLAWYSAWSARLTSSSASTSCGAERSPADAQRDLRRGGGHATAQRRQLFDRAAELLGDHHHLGQRVAGQDRPELVAAQPTDHVGAPQPLAAAVRRPAAGRDHPSGGRGGR